MKKSVSLKTALSNVVWIYLQIYICKVCIYLVKKKKNLCTLFNKKEKFSFSLLSNFWVKSVEGIERRRLMWLGFRRCCKLEISFSMMRHAE